ncbi:MAG: nucleoside 2-deoxyribosyltransferase [Erysipelotrichaceae bacterium]|nr:nucleoside 2-deoxyribosyltransferase [Erysipelotrichaceae bacterium]
MNKKVYFAGSIRGGREDAQLYKDAIEHIQQTDTVLTEHVGDLTRSIHEQERDRDNLIYTQDTNWLKECDLVIAECTRPSLGVGYELAYAENLNKPVYVFYRPEMCQLSAMIKGDQYFHISTYSTKEELFQKINNILQK